MRFFRVSCRQVRARLQAIDNEALRGRGQSEIAQHLVKCASCRAESERLANIAHALYHSAPNVPPMSSQATDALLACVLAESHKASPLLPDVWRRRRLVWLALSGSAAAALALLVLHPTRLPPEAPRNPFAAKSNPPMPLHPPSKSSRVPLPVPLAPTRTHNAHLAEADTNRPLPKATGNFGPHSFRPHLARLARHAYRRKLRRAETYLAQRETPVRPLAKSVPQATQLLALAFPNGPQTGNDEPKGTLLPAAPVSLVPARARPLAPTVSASPRLLVTTRFLPPMTATVTQDSINKPGYARVTAYEPSQKDSAGASRTVIAELRNGRLALARRSVAASAQLTGPNLIVTVTEPTVDGLARPQGVSQ